jgi:ribosomal protein S18 acetylase RimI-like enzyme
MEFKTLEQYPLEKIVDAFNLAFSDYHVPISKSLESLTTKLATENGRLDLSVGAFEGDQLVGFILHYADGKFLYNGGTGVVPSHRGQRLVEQMYNFILPKCFEQGIDTSVLEVLEVNQKAIACYLKQGFKIVRKVDCFKGQLNVQPKDSNFEIKPIFSPNWELFQSLWEVTPTWQNSIMAVDNQLKDLKILGVFDTEKLVGYAIYNSNTKKLHQIAVHNDYRRKGMGTQLLAHIQQHDNGNYVILNCDQKCTAIKPFFEKAGMGLLTTQYEMILEK